MNRRGKMEDCKGRTEEMVEDIGKNGKDLKRNRGRGIRGEEKGKERNGGRGGLIRKRRGV
jgi:hypothetical protein